MQRTIRFRLNTEEHTITLEKEQPALDWIRNTAQLKGTKEGCREGDCGACMVILGEYIENQPVYRAVTSCTLGLSDLDGKHIITIEGIAAAGITPVMQAFLETGASQCGFCSPGFVVALTALFIEGGPIDYHHAITAIDGNLCRCTGYGSIRRATAKLIEDFPELPEDFDMRLDFLAKKGVLPQALADTMHKLPEPIREIVSTTKTLGGGTDFFVQNPDPDQELIPCYTDLEPHAQQIRLEHDRLIIGSAVTMRDFFASERIRAMYPGIEQYEQYIASTPIRNRATLAGNIANASPIADMTVLLLALGAELIIKNDHGSSRTLPLLNTFIGYKKLAINSDERIDAIMIPAKALKISFEKVSKREHLDIATVNSALAVEEARDGTIKQARLAIGGVAPIPLVIEETAAILQGSKPAAERILQAAEHAQAAVSPITDVRGTSEYRKRLVYRLVLAHAIRLWPEREEELLP